MSSLSRKQAITDIKERDDRLNWFGHYMLENLQREWVKHRKDEACAPDFYVIRTVTLLEVFTRRNLADLIDHDSRFMERAIELSKHVKIDFALVRDIQGRVITLGDILAFSVPVNSFGQIVGHFEAVLGKPLRPMLEGAVDRWEAEVIKKSPGLIIDDYDSLARCLSRLFEVRHILCHEAPREAVYKTDEIDQFLDKAIRLCKALQEILTFEKFGRVPLTQTEMNIAAGEDLKKAEAEMDRLFSEIETKVRDSEARYIAVGGRKEEDSWLATLQDAQQKWLAYRKAHCEFDTYLSRRGTIHPLLWAIEAKRLTEARISDFKSWLKSNSER